ncbi:MAG TPA: 4Fe-4S dicluster domain-containing protein, partial [Candidatus Limnocylindrales bacterium]
MGYRIDIEPRGCINCGICMDVCPVEALDMSRPDRPGVESGPADRAPARWMMEHPIQVGECIGCGICVRECPTVTMSLTVLDGMVPIAPRQGPIHRPLIEEGGWTPLSAITTESLKPVHTSPWGGLFQWRTAERPEAWQTWRSMTGDSSPGPLAPCQAACPAGTDAGRYVGLVAQGRYAEAYAVAAEVNPFPSVCGWICTAPCEQAC